MYDIKALKKTSGDIERLTKEIDKMNQGEFQADTRYWKPTRDKAGNASAIIRFLPSPPMDGEDGLPWSQPLFHHSFQGPTGKWYIENSLTTLKKNDPVSEFNSKLWERGKVDDSPERKQARKQKRKLSYVSNILVVADPQAPENEGKVFLYSYGVKIWDKIQNTIKPPKDDLDPVEPVPVFDPWLGANFKLKVKTIAQKGEIRGMPNYDDSVFMAPSPIGTDDEIEKIWKSEYSLKAITGPDQFKSYEELKSRLNFVMGENSEPQTEVSPESEDISVPFDTKNTADSDDEDLAAFRKLAEE